MIRTILYSLWLPILVVAISVVRFGFQFVLSGPDLNQFLVLFAPGLAGGGAVDPGSPLGAPAFPGPGDRVCIGFGAGCPGRSHYGRSVRSGWSSWIPGRRFSPRMGAPGDPRPHPKRQEEPGLRPLTAERRRLYQALGPQN